MRDNTRFEFRKFFTFRPGSPEKGGDEDDESGCSGRSSPIACEKGSQMDGDFRQKAFFPTHSDLIRRAEAGLHREVDVSDLMAVAHV